MDTQILDAWRMACEANAFLLRSLPDEALEDRYAPRTRTVAAQFVHMHNVRVRWLGHAAPKLVRGLTSFPRGAGPSKDQLLAALEASEDAVHRFLEQCVAANKVPQWKGAPATFLAYLVAHEAHHRGLAMVALRLCGHKPPNEVVYGQWDWGKARSLR